MWRAPILVTMTNQESGQISAQQTIILWGKGNETGAGFLPNDNHLGKNRQTKGNIQEEWEKNC